MCEVARLLEQRRVNIPLIIGGATTSEKHTALKIAPLYSGAVFHSKDAAYNVQIAEQLRHAESREAYIMANTELQQKIQESEKSSQLLTWEEATHRKPSLT